jgi:hypothetical protein
LNDSTCPFCIGCDRAHSFGDTRIVDTSNAVLKRSPWTGRESAGCTFTQAFGDQNLHRVFPL